MKKDTEFWGIRYLDMTSKAIALTVGVGLLLASVLIIAHAFRVLYSQDIDTAIQDGLFVLILLEMFYVTKSFIKYGSINVGIVISVGMIAAVKELIFQLDSLTLQIAIAFGVILVTLSVAYLVEMLYYSKKNS